MLRIDHVNLHVRDPQAAIAFFAAVLGTVEGPRPAFRHPGHWLYLDGQPAIHVDHAADGEELRRGVFDHIAFGVFDDAEALLARIEAAGYPHHLAGIPGGVGQVFVTGPDDLKIELQYRR